MNELRELVTKYLLVRRAMGFKLVTVEQILERYLGFMEEHHYRSQNLANTLEWADTGKTPQVQSRLLSTARVFVRWARAFDPTMELVPVHLKQAQTRRAIPYIYTLEEVAALMGCAARLPRPYRAATYWTVLGLLSCTGMRVGEMLRLQRDDVGGGLIHINESKFGKSRVIPVGPDTSRAMENYARLRESKFPVPVTEAFFVSLSGTRLHYANVQRAVHQFTLDAGIEAISKDHRPRIHDLRHTFAVHTLRDAYLKGQDPARILPILSTYLGHVSVESTYWYLEAEPGLLNAAAGLLPSLLAPIEETP